MELLNNTVLKILQIVNNYAVPMNEIWENNKNQMVNQKQFKGRKKYIVVCNFNWNRRNKIRRLTMLICRSVSSKTSKKAMNALQSGIDGRNGTELERKNSITHTHTVEVEHHG